MESWIYILIFVVVFIAFDIFFVIYIAKKKHTISRQERKKYLEHWKEIRGERDLAKAVMEADKLLDVLLRKKGYTGSLGEKLKTSGSLFKDIDGVWRAHKLRNRLAHEIKPTVSGKEARNALSSFELAFRDLGLFKF